MKMTLLTVITPTLCALHLLNFVYKWKKVGPEFWLAQDQLLRMLISWLLRVNAPCKNLQLLEDKQGFVVYKQVSK